MNNKDCNDKKATFLNRVGEGLVTTLRRLFSGDAPEQQQEEANNVTTTATIQENHELENTINDRLSNAITKIFLSPSDVPINDKPEIKFLFRDNCYAIEVFQNGVTKISTDSFGNIWTPLYLSMAENTVKIGQEAKNHFESFPEFVIYDILQIIGNELNEIKIDPKWGFKLVEKDENVYFQIETLLNGPRLFPPELVLSAFLKVMKIQTQTFLETSNGIKEIQISTNFQLTESQKAVFEKAAAKNDLSILSFIVSVVQ